MNINVVPQPAPRKSFHPAVWDLVIADMRARDLFGVSKYATRLQPHNGRDALVDAYQEALDLCVYLRQLIYERAESHGDAERRSFLDPGTHQAQTEQDAGERLSERGPRS